MHTTSNLTINHFDSLTSIDGQLTTQHCVSITYFLHKNNVKTKVNKVYILKSYQPDNSPKQTIFNLFKRNINNAIS